MLEIGNIVEVVDEIEDSVIELGSQLEIVDVIENDVYVYYGYEILPIPKFALQRVWK
ncbi:hypothetical protein HCJ58_04955 [Listeria sp. FSL L7-1509]|uniref:Uncharacterized protein n=1 Tax=Listeria immobilis TaxID=2713502 RepID=A0ABR6SUN0_9LIST|nr:hypothetical protein [Listeria immobilis]MBC1506324.1 hypothetical protein [Listeria immobilis]MBC1509396.1 hypothetical protein [Listeria immobilis]MBC6304527.1 hypothetical protein [Listeria immobilis]MBC6312069.1 hypothetical protein [Listeria immobilis]